MMRNPITLLLNWIESWFVKDEKKEIARLKYELREKSHQIIQLQHLLQQTQEQLSYCKSNREKEVEMYRKEIETLQKQLQQLKDELATYQAVVDKDKLTLQKVIYSYLDKHYPRVLLEYSKRWVLDKKSKKVKLMAQDFIQPNKWLAWKFKGADLKTIWTYPLEYVSDNYQYHGCLDVWQLPIETYVLRKGDCLVEDTLLLKDDLTFVEIKDIKVGDRIIGLNGKPVRVLNKWDKGELDVYEVKLSNNSTILATSEHRFFLKDRRIVRLDELKVGDELLVPSIIYFDEFEKPNPDYWKLVGLYISDGWYDKNKKIISISGRDGMKKEQQKLWVKEFCEKNGLRYYWHKRYISIMDKEFSKEFEKYGIHSYEKRLITLPKNPVNILALIEGLDADSNIKKNGVKTYSTTSYVLALQYRILNMMLGYPTSIAYVVNHGGFGNHPIYRVYVQQKQRRRVRVESITHVGKRHVYDIQTEDSGIYLPENNVVVHNCDDSTAFRVAAAKSIGLEKDFLLFMAVGFYIDGSKKIGHAFPVMITKSLKWYVLEATSNIYYPLPYPNSKYQIHFLWDENYCWKVGDVTFGGKILKEFDLKTRE